MKPAATAANATPVLRTISSRALCFLQGVSRYRQITLDPPPLRGRPFRRASPATSPKNLRFSGEASLPLVINYAASRVPLRQRDSICQPFGLSGKVSGARYFVANARRENILRIA